MNKYYKANKELWDEKVDIHKVSDFYRLEDFKNGWNSLKSIELEGIGDVSENLYCICNVILDKIRCLGQEWVQR